MSTMLEEGLRLGSGRYVLERRLGSGAAATVWLARDNVLDRPVAAKVLSEALAEDEAWMARFRREARVAARLNHPNLVRVYDFDATAHPPFLVMSYVPSGSLQTRLDTGGAPDAERLAAELLSALAHIHEGGIVHRDVKPANVLFERDGRACLTDFGIARPEDATSITQTGQIPGTARYMAPELWRGEPASPRSDLYSLGVLLSECLREDSPQPLYALVERMRADDPERRPPSASAALSELEDEPTLPLATPPAPPPPATPIIAEEGRPNRGRVAAVLGLVVLMVVAGLAIAGAFGGDDEPTAGGAQDGRAEQSDQPKEKEPPADDATTVDSQPPVDEAATTTTDPVALNDEGYALMQAGRFDEAIPLLQQAVAGLEGSDDITYAYALFNLGSALRQAGRPEEAIPILEQRLEIPNQTETVQAELDLAYAAAGTEADVSEPSGKAKGHEKKD